MERHRMQYLSPVVVTVKESLQVSSPGAGESSWRSRGRRARNVLAGRWFPWRNLPIFELCVRLADRGLEYALSV
ncbi:hypothetical protein NDU88_001672 [Pleurodeles waltl]|uniref:Uncharacterized protein n=1 Tax=Pleurodeles waltl TaxID=8319 RepID=A0AAV7T0V9_PLEWA|nr:hypothetical protein NDU88_001672 [Pleurodeles waltl]